MKSKASSHPRRPGRTAPGPAPCSAETAEQTKAFRKKMSKTGRVVSRVAKMLASNDPAQWGRGAYLALLGRVNDTLNGRKVRVTAADLVVLSRIVAEQRRAETQSGPTKSRKAAGKKPPEQLRDAVRRIYGASLQTDVKDASEAGE